MGSSTFPFLKNIRSLNKLTEPLNYILILISIFIVSDFGDFWFGFFKPVRDLVGSLFVYALLIGFGEIRHSTIQNSDFTFNIWGFLLIFICVSSILEIASEVFSDLKHGYKEPIESVIRILGFIIGTMIFSFVLIPLYSSIGGNIGDIVISEIVASICMLIGIIFRLHFHNKSSY